MKKFKDEQTKAREAAASASNVIIEQPVKFGVCLEIQGTADLIQNCFAQKIIEQLLRKHMGLTVQREKKVPRQQLDDAKIKNIKGDIVMPPVAFKLAMLTAATQTKSLKKTQLRNSLFVDGQSIPIEYRDMIPRMDMVRTSGIGRTPDIRFRPSFSDWKAKLFISFSDQIPVQTVVDLLNRAGNVGVGEWRPEHNGTFGTFRVLRNIQDPDEIDRVIERCSIPIVKPIIPAWAMDLDIDPEILKKMFAGQGSSVDGPVGDVVEA